MSMKWILGLVCLCAFAVKVEAQKVTYRSSAHYNERVKVFEKDSLPGSADIVMLGDSHTEFGGNWSERLVTGRRIVNRGIIGDDAKGILHRLSQVCPGKPAAIFFECGANDLSHGLTAEQVVDGLIKTIEAIRSQSPESRLYVQSVFPINESFGRWKTLTGKTDVIPQINALLRDYCRSKGIAYIDVFSLLVGDEGNSMRKEICKDGLHLLPSGYDIWAAEVQRVLDENAFGK